MHPRDRHLIDQAEAAAEVVDHTVHFIAGVMQQPLHRGAPVPRWMPTSFHAACPHIGNQPMPVAAMLTDPSALMCHACLMPAMLRNAEEKPDDCDLCGLPAPERRFYETVAYRGPLMFMGNICKPCYESWER